MQYCYWCSDGFWRRPCKGIVFLYCIWFCIIKNNGTQDAEDLFRGGFFCSEAVVCTIRSNYALCCRILTKEFDMGAGEHKEQCIRFTGLVAGKVAEMIIWEKGLTNIDE
ncbi:hypothetical protein [Clostridium sp. 1001283B150225_161107_B6]|uniref:hypothetical protein n=1 Tax=Clostridia TaxID=186801 RepID=UPI001FAB56BE|nr:MULTISPECIES: hypothetical protein [Clostridia]